MAADTSISKLSLERRADIIFKKMILDCDTKEGIKYSIAGAVFNNQVTKLSEEAYKIIKKKYLKNLHANFFFSNRTYSDLRIEHVVPVEFIYRAFKEKLDNGTLTKDFIENSLNKAFIALITPDEDKLLNKAKFRNTMPAGFTLDGHMDPLVRYSKSGIVMHQWP